MRFAAAQPTKCPACVSATTPGFGFGFGFGLRFGSGFGRAGPLGLR